MNGPDDEGEEFELSQDELHPEQEPEAWEAVAAREAAVPRFGEI